MLQCKWHSEAFSWWPSLPGSWEQSYEISDTHAGHRLASGWKGFYRLPKHCTFTYIHPKAEQMAKRSIAFHIQAAVRVMLARHCFGRVLSICLSNIELYRTILRCWSDFVRYFSGASGIFEIFGIHWVYCTFGGIHLPSGQSARRKARLLSAKRCMALSWADDIMIWWPAKLIWSNMFCNLWILRIHMNTYNYIHNVYAQRLTACMDAMDNRHTLKHVLWDIHMHS